MDRRRFLKWTLGSAAAAAVGSTSPILSQRAQAAQTPARRPNIIVILSDDMGFSDLGCYGSEINTPNLDKLAAGGVRFTQFYNTARCCPTRACLLTGLYPHQAAVGHMMENRGLDGYQGDLSHNAVTIAEVLKPAGYASYAIGKWHVTRHEKPEGPKHNWPLQRGFDRYYGTITGAGNFWDPVSLVRDNTMISPFADPQYKPKQYYYTDALSDHAIRFVDEHQKAAPDKPFFMYVAYTCAHWPMHAPEEEIAKYKGKYDGGYDPIRKARFGKMKKLGLIRPDCELSPQHGDWSKVEHKAWEARCMEVYAAMIDRMDQGIGRLVETLRKNGQLDNTLILYMQDNGGCQEAMGRSGDEKRPEKPTQPPVPPETVLSARQKFTREGMPILGGPNVMPGPGDTFIGYGMSWANVSNTPFREYKHYVHEGGVSTPLVAHWPRGISRAGELERQPGHLIDIMATCVALAGAEYPKQHKGNAVQPMEGVSLLPALAGQALQREAIYWEHEGNRAIRIGQWKLVAKGPGSKWELYDVEKDRPELHDLAESQPQRVKEMAEKWEAWAKRTKVLPWPWKPGYGQAAAAGKAVYELKAGDQLPSEESPQIAGRPITITASIAAAGNGVIVAQGGTAHGYVLYVQDGKLAMTTRHVNKMTTVAASDALPKGPVQVAAKLVKGGGITLSIDGKVVATGKAPGLIKQMPVDGLQVGQDAAGLVGPYSQENKFAGKIESVKIELGE